MVVEKMGMGLQPIKINYFWNIKMNNNKQISFTYFKLHLPKRNALLLLLHVPL